MSDIVYVKKVHRVTTEDYLKDVPYYFVYVSGATFVTQNEQEAATHAFQNRANLISPTIEFDPDVHVYIAQITVTEYDQCGSQDILVKKYKIEYLNDWYYITEKTGEDKTYRLYYMDISDIDSDDYPSDFVYGDGEVTEYTTTDVDRIREEAELIMRSTTRYLVKMPEDRETELEADAWDISIKTDVGFVRTVSNTTQAVSACQLKQAQENLGTDEPEAKKVCAGTIIITAILTATVTALGLASYFNLF